MDILPAPNHQQPTPDETPRRIALALKGASQATRPCLKRVCQAQAGWTVFRGLGGVLASTVEAREAPRSCWYSSLSLTNFVHLHSLNGRSYRDASRTLQFKPLEARFDDEYRHCCYHSRSLTDISNADSYQIQDPRLSLNRVKPTVFSRFRDALVSWLQSSFWWLPLADRLIVRGWRLANRAQAHGAPCSWNPSTGSIMAEIKGAVNEGRRLLTLGTTFSLPMLQDSVCDSAIVDEETYPYVYW